MKRGRRPNRFSRGDLALAFEMAQSVGAFGVTLHLDRGDITVRLKEYERLPATSSDFSFSGGETETDDWTDGEEVS